MPREQLALQPRWRRGRHQKMLLIAALALTVLPSLGGGVAGWRVKNETPAELVNSVNSLIECWNTHGKWHHTTKPASITEKSCAGSARYSQNECTSLTRNETGNFHPHYHYHWHVEKGKCAAPFHPWSFDDTCALFEGERLMFVGDSIQEEFYFTFLSSLWKNNWPENCDPSSIKTIKCGSIGVQVSSIRNDRLSLVSGTPENSKTEERPWIVELEKQQTTILVLNRGAHFVDDETLTKELRTTMLHLKQNFPHLLIIYRSTPAGHLKPESTFTSPPLSEYKSGIDETGETFHYSEFPRQNNLTRHFLKSEFPGVIFIDVYPSTVLRGDSHPDPLHYCLPGPIDNWVRILSNSMAALNNSVAATATYTPAMQSDDAILAQWKGFHGDAGARKCGGGAWMHNYTQLHKNTMSSPAPRLFVSTSGGQGATDRIVGHLTGFFAALLSDRAFVLDAYAGSLTFDAAFDYPELDVRLPSALRKEVDEAWNHPGNKIIFEANPKIGIVHYHDGVPIFTPQYPSEAYDLIFGPKQLLILSGNRGNIYNLILNSNYTHVFQKMQLPAKYGVYCAFHYLFKPNVETLSLAYPYSSQLADKSVLKIGIQIRTGDSTSFWGRSGHAGFTVDHNVTIDKYMAFFTCAELIEKQLKVSSRWGQKVLWYLMSDSLPLRVDAKKRYGAKLITDTESIPLHTGINGKNGNSVMRQVMSEVLTLSLCDYWALTSNSGVGKFASWISPNREVNNTFIVDSRSCKAYPDADMAISNQGIRR